MTNFGGAYGQVTQFNGSAAQTPYNHSGKHSVKVVGGVVGASTQPKLLFAALSDVGKIDVLELQSGRRIRTIDVPGVRVVSCYWRQ